MIRGFMPLGVAHLRIQKDSKMFAAVIRGFMPLGVAHLSFVEPSVAAPKSDSWLDAVRRCSTEAIAKSKKLGVVICGLMLLGVAQKRSPEKPLRLAEFDKQVALEALCHGQTVIPFWGDRIHEILQQNLKRFTE